MTYDIGQPLQPPFQHHRRSLSPAPGDRGSAQQHLAAMDGLGPDDGYDWLQRIGRTPVSRRGTERRVARARPSLSSLA